MNEYGEVVGINSIGMTTSSTVQFSVPINQVKDAITALANGRVRSLVEVGDWGVVYCTVPYRSNFVTD